MCGRYNLNDTQQVRHLLSQLGVADQQIRFSADISPAAHISIVRQLGSQRVISTAIWWLMLDPETGKPTKYTSFNSRSDKLNSTRSIACKPYRETRCIIPASAFIEGLGDSKTYHKIELEGQAIAFGGLYREWCSKETGEIVIGASIITLGRLVQWQNIHPDSMPLILPVDQTEVINAWLAPDVNDVERFEPLLEPGIRIPQRITPIDRPSKWNPIGDSYVIS